MTAASPKTLPAPPVPLQPWRYLYRVPLLLLALAALPLLLVLLLPGLRSLRLGSERLRTRFQRRCARWLIAALGMRLSIRGRLPDGPFLLVANHISWFDILLLHALAPLWLVAKDGIRGWPLIGGLARAVGTIFIRRGDESSRRRAARRMAALLRRGEIVGVFPEAGISAERGVGRFHARLFGPALRAGVPVLPVAIRYWRNGDAHDERVFGPGRSFLGLLLSMLGRAPCRAELLLGAPIPTAGAARSEVARRAELEVRGMYDEPADD